MLYLAQDYRRVGSRCSRSVKYLRSQPGSLKSRLRLPHVSALPNHCETHAFNHSDEFSLQELLL